jgi:uncharacterized protein YjiS (DUF1127 family)
MFETAMSRPTAYELQRQARREQARMINAFVVSAARKLADWLIAPVRNGAKVAHAVAAEWRLRQDIRTLRQFGDRTLRDMGLTRGEIEHVVRNGRPWHAMDWAGYTAPAMAVMRGGPGRTRTSNQTVMSGRL